MDTVGVRTWPLCCAWHARKAEKASGGAAPATPAAGCGVRSAAAPTAAAPEAAGSQGGMAGTKGGMMSGVRPA